MSSLNSIKQKLRPLGLYNLDYSSLIHAELTAYSVVLDEIKRQLEKIEKERFIATAENFGLSTRERTFGAEQTEKSIENRRNILLYRSAICPTDFNKSRLKELMKIAGITCNIVEYPEQNALYIACFELNDPSADKNALQRMVEEFLPAHLEYTFEFTTMQWDVIDSKNNTFDFMDSKKLTWDEIDNL